MKKLEDLITNERLSLRLCYYLYEKHDSKIVFKKTQKTVSSTIQIKELLELRDIANGCDNLEFSVLENEDVEIKMKR